MKPRAISVLGCGWLGLALAERLVALGHTVRGSTTSTEKLDRIAAVGAESHRIVIGEDVEGDGRGAFFSSDVLVFCMPPSRNNGPDYTSQARAVRRACEEGRIGWVIMTSSTSVYPDLDAVVTESDAGAREGMPLRRNGPDVLSAERVFWGSTTFETTVLRLAGLYGYGRHPARYFAGRENLAGGEAPVNLVHRDDVIGAVEAVLEQEAQGTVFNVCANHHPTRRRLYPAQAQRLGLMPPTFDGVEAEGYKIVSNTKLRNRLGYTFTYPDPMTPAP